MMMRFQTFHMKVYQLVTTEDDNEEVYKWGEVPNFTLKPKPHWDLGTDLSIIDFERAGKVTGSRFVFYHRLRCSFRTCALELYDGFSC